MAHPTRLPIPPVRWGIVLAVLLTAGTALAGSSDATAPASRVPRPLVDAARGEKCVADTDFMRRNHMQLLLHQRDETVHEGVRGKAFSLNGCIECHASRTTGRVIGSDQNFCQGCHSYAAVKLDCFECHASQPASARRARENLVGAAR
jgi:[DsrC]-trisulfide reductase subunit J